MECSLYPPTFRRPSNGIFDELAERLVLAKHFIELRAQRGLVVFGAGYGFEALDEARWMHDRRIHYWGDIDTHGFAILDQLRVHFPHVESLLMDRTTLIAHRAQWTDEPQPVLRDLASLSPGERELFDDLRWKRLADCHVRLEQERIGFRHLQEALAKLTPPDGPGIGRGT